MDRREPTAEQVATARSFVDARRSARGLPDYPGAVPQTLAEAYLIQDAAIRIDGRRVAGWKVGRINPPREGADRLAGPIFADAVRHGDDAAMAILADGFAAAEAEYVLRVGRTLDPAKTRYTLDEARAAIDAVHVGIEIASSPFPGINAGGAAVTISDFGNNNGLLIGRPADGWREGDINGWRVELLIDGQPIGDATAAIMLDGPFGAARFLFEHLARRGIAVEAGQWISSGAVTGVHEVTIGQRVEARFDGGFAVACTIEAQEGEAR